MANDQEGKKSFKRHRWNDAHIDRGNGMGVIVQKGLLALRWRPSTTHQVFFHRRLGHLKTQQQQLVNAGCAPKRIFLAHPLDQISQIPGQSSAALPASATSSGLVEMRRHHGPVVKQLTLVELVEMFQVMAELEGLCARLSARRMTLAERKQLRQIHKRAGKSIADHDFEGFFEINNEFHEAIFVGSKNQFLQQESRALRSRVNPYRRYITYQPGRMGKSHNEHEEIIGSIENGNADLAQH